MTAELDADVAALLDGIQSELRRADARHLVEMMQRITGKPPKLWSGSIIGFGQYHYRYESGHEGDSCLVGFSPRKSEFSIYLTGIYFPESSEPARLLLERLGKHGMGKACLYVRKLADIDEAVLTKLIEFSVAELREHYPYH